MIDKITARRAAEDLLNQYKNRQAQSNLPAGISSGPLEDAYLIQEQFQQLLQADGRGDIVGYKIALTSKAMQQMCGVDQPLAGAIFSSVVQQSPAQITLSDFQHVGVEFEVAVKLSADLPGGNSPHTRDNVATAVASCAPAFELVEDRNADYSDMNAFSLIADNCWNGGVILGAAVADWQTLDLENATTRLWTNDQATDQAKVGDAMGHPFEVVAWVANLLNRQGKMLKKDMLIMTGSSITTKFPEAGQQLRFAIDGMGEAHLQLH